MQVNNHKWIWTQWLRPIKRTGVNYQGFKHLEFIEEPTNRISIEDNLAKLLYSYHTSSFIGANLLTQLRYHRLASVFTGNRDQRPTDRDTRSAHLIEILACEFAKQLGYDIPVMRLRYNPNPNQSMKGDDIMGFKFSENSQERTSFLIGEGKFRSKFTQAAVRAGYADLEKKDRSSPLSMEFVSSILSLRGETQKASKIRQMRQMLISRKQVQRINLLFMGSMTEPTSPFESLEKDPNNLLPNLIAANILFKEDFYEWISNVYERKFW